MSDYIKRDDALNIDFKIRVGAFDNRKTTATNAVQAYADAIAKIPSEDVRPVVLCKDCKWCHAGYCEKYDDLILFGYAKKPWSDWFCADGEKREES